MRESPFVQEWIEEGRREGFLEAFVAAYLVARRETHRETYTEEYLDAQRRGWRSYLISRYGPLPDWAESRIAEAGSAEIEGWSDRSLRAGALAQLLGE